MNSGVIPTRGSKSVAAADRELIAVDVNALRQVLLALVGPPHLVRELQATRSLSLHQLGHPSPIDVLCEQLDAWRPGTGGTTQLSESERAELLDWVSACQSAYHIDSTPGHRFAALTSNLQENRVGLAGYVDELLAKRANRAVVAPACPDPSGAKEPA